MVAAHHKAGKFKTECHDRYGIWTAVTSNTIQLTGNTVVKMSHHMTRTGVHDYNGTPGAQYNPGYRQGIYVTMVSLGFCARKYIRISEIVVFNEPIDYDGITHFVQPRLLHMLARGEGEEPTRILLE